MLSWLKRVIAPASPVPTRTPKALQAAVFDEDVPRYPPFMKGLPVISPDRLIVSQTELLTQLSSSVLTNRSLYEKHYIGAIKRFAGYAHLLPASQSHHHRGAGGLLRHSIEVGLWALQASDKMLIDVGKTAAHRRELEPRWQLTAFLGGLCHDAGKPAVDVSVSSHDRTKVWKPIKESLWEWANDQCVDAYFVDWRAGRSKQHIALSNLIAERIISTETLAWIEEGGTELIVWLMESLNGTPSNTNPLYDIILKADQASVERDLKSMGVAMAGYEIGVPVERHLTDIMRRLIRQGIWGVNEPGARVWNIDGSIYLVWPASGDEIARQVNEDGIPGIPRTADGILDMLVERQLAFVRDDPESQFWKIAPACLAAKIPDIALSCIRLRNDSLISTTPISAVDGKLLGVVEPRSTQSAIPSAQAGNSTTSTVEASSAVVGSGDAQITDSSPFSTGAEPEQGAEAEQKKRSSSAKPGKTSKSTPMLAPAAGQSVPGPQITPSGERIDLDTGEIISAPAEAATPEQSCISSSSSAITTPAPKVAATPKASPKKREKPTLVFDGAAGEAVKALAEDLKSRTKKWGADALVEADGRVLLAWPAAFAGYGLTPKVILDEMASKNWIWVDEMSPLVKVHEVEIAGGVVRAIRLHHDASDALLYAADHDGMPTTALLQAQAVIEIAPEIEPPRVEAEPHAPSTTMPDQPPQVQAEDLASTVDVKAAKEEAVETKAISSRPQSEQQKPKNDGQKKAKPARDGAARSFPRPTSQPQAQAPVPTQPQPQPQAQAQAGEQAKVQKQEDRKSSPLRPQSSQPIPGSIASQGSQVASMPPEVKSVAGKLLSPVELNDWNTQLVLGALQGLGGDPDENGWKRLFLNEVSAALKKSGLGFERSKLHALVKANPDQFRIVKSHFFYFR